MGATFSTLKLFEQLEQAGVSAPQARLFADLFAKSQKTEDLATKSDVENDFKTLELRIDHKFEKIRSDLKSDMHDLKVDLIRWTISLLFGQTALLATVVIGLKIFGG